MTEKTRQFIEKHDEICINLQINDFFSATTHQTLPIMVPLQSTL